MNYTERIRALREDNNLTQKAVAAYLGVAQRTYADYESGHTRLPIDRLILLAKYYDVSVDYIAGITNNKREFPRL